MAVRPVRFISDVLTRKQILKTDSDDNLLFKVSGSLIDGGTVSSSFPITGSGLYIDGDATIEGTLTAKRMHVTEVTSSVYYESAISASINALNDVSASHAVPGQFLRWSGTNWEPASINLSGAIADGISNINQVFQSSSALVIDYFDPNGSKTINFNNFFSSDLEYLTLDVMVMQSGTSFYTNDLISVVMYINTSGTISVELNAASLSNGDKFKLLLNKQVTSII